jgi:Capsular polysaccharide synthesis protein
MRFALAFLSSMVALINLLVGVYIDELQFAFTTIQKVRSFITTKQTFPALHHESLLGRWPEPPTTRRLALGNDRKTIWGYWHQGEDQLPGFCQLAVESWRVHHPDWNIVILSLDNFHHYVSPSDLPSTFYSLKIQHQSDMVRLAVMRRYGGLYLDASYVLFRSMNDLWDEAERTNSLYLTAPLSIPYDGHHDEVTGEQIYLPIPNNAFLLMPHAHNPVFATWLQKSRAYLENPSYTMADMKHHPGMARVAPFIGHDAFGPLKNMAPYICNLWTLTDVLYYETDLADYVADHVYVLPTLMWTFDFVE